MRKIVAAILLCGLALTAGAVPAKRGWQTRTQADGTSIEVQVVGDEFYHYTINSEGQQVREVNGMYEVVGEAPSAAKVQARRATVKKANIRKAKKEFGVTPNLAPRGIVIMVNFSDKSFNTSNTRAVIDSLCNAVNCKVNKSGSTMYPSAGQYFKDQSNGAYAPIFDVFGPISLSHNMEYYGANDVAGNDIRPANMLVEACKKADTQFNVDFTQYDSDNDGKIDFVYIIYAGQGEASGAAEETIWPHSYSIDETIEVDEYYTTTAGAREWRRDYGEDYIPYFSNEYSLSDCFVDGKQINTYACSNELSGNDLDGIGTLCHEFSHVMGLPDYYDTNYDTNYKQALTPNDWDVMDGGAYNGGGHCPPNYSAWEKYFFGWHTPINLGNEGQNLTLKANGTEGYQAYQINTNGTQITATTAGECYYIENRQAVGWDRGLPHHGLLIWKVNYSQNAWVNNAPNNTANSPLYTLVSASGTKIGKHLNSSETAYVYDGPKNPYPGSANVTSKTIAGKPLLNIAESNQVVTLTYIEEPSIVVDPFNVQFMAFGKPFDTVESTGKLVLPATEPVACSDGREFVGWCSQANYSNPTTAPTFAKAGDVVAEGAVFYAVFADMEGEGGTETTWDLVSNASSLSAGDVLVMACSSKGFTAGDISSQIMASVASTFSSNKNQITSLGSETVELTLGGSEGAWTLSSASGKLGATAVKKLAWGSGTTTWSISISGGDATIQNTTESYGRFLYNVNSPRFTTYTSNTSASMLLPQLYRKTGGGATYSNYSTACAHGTDIETVQSAAAGAQKAIRNGQIVIIRGEEVYTLTGERIQ